MGLLEAFYSIFDSGNMRISHWGGVDTFTPAEEDNGLQIIDFDGKDSTPTVSHSLSYFLVTTGIKTYQVYFEGSLRQFLCELSSNKLGLFSKE